MLEVRNVSKSFFRKVALDDVSITVNAGEIYGLLGPNGAGKTTLIRVINRIIQPDSGHVRFKGDLMTQQHLSQIGYLPEERGLYRSMTVEDHALFLGQLRGLSKNDVKAKFDYWIERFEIGDWKRKRIEELLHEPSLLILDEPFSGFDPINVELIKQELIEMRAKGKTIILSSHNMRSVEEICDRVALINKSKKVVEGRVSELQEDRKTGLYAVRFRGNMIAFVNALWTGFEIEDKDILGDDRFVVRVKMRGDSSFEDLLKVLMGQVKIEAAWEVYPSMQDIFMELVKERKEVSHEE
jgi:ABC-2 type transport system ATP-binding protein